jgi:Outer membrane efflux protein
VLKMMFWSKLKTNAAIVLAGALLSGTAVMGHRAMGRAQAPKAAARQQTEKQAQPGENSAVPASSGVESSDLDAIGKARIEVAQQMRDGAESLWRNGEISLGQYLTLQKRYDEAVADVTVKTDADRVRFLERQVALFKQIEEAARKQYDRGQVPLFDMHAAKLSRLDAEYALAKAKVKAGSTLK